MHVVLFRFPQLSSAIVHTLRVFFLKMRMCSMAGGRFPSLHRNRGSSRALKSAAEVPGKGLWGGSGCQSKGNGRTVQRKRRGSQGFQGFFSSFLVGGHSFQFGFSFLAGGAQKATVFSRPYQGLQRTLYQGLQRTRSWEPARFTCRRETWLARYSLQSLEVCALDDVFPDDNSIRLWGLLILRVA